MDLSSTSAGTIILHWDEEQATREASDIIMVIYFLDTSTSTLRYRNMSYTVRIVMAVFRLWYVCSAMVGVVTIEIVR